MRQQERPGINGLTIALEIERGAHFALLPAALAPSCEVLALQNLVDEGGFVGDARGGGTNTHGLKIGDSAREELAIEAENDAAKRHGIGTGVGGVTECALWGEGGGAEGEVEEDAVSDGGVDRGRRRWGIGTGRRRRWVRRRDNLVIGEGREGRGSGEEEE